MFEQVTVIDHYSDFNRSERDNYSYQENRARELEIDDRF